MILDIKTEIPAAYENYLLRLKEDEPIVISFFEGRDWIEDLNCAFTLQQLIHNPTQELVISPGLAKGEYGVLFGIGSSTDLFTANSEKIKVTIE